MAQILEAKGRRRRGRWLAVVPCVIGLAGCNEQNAYVPPPPPKVTVAQPVKQPVVSYLALTGSTEAYNARRSGGPGAGLSGVDRLQGRGAGEAGHPAVPHPARHLRGPTGTGQGGPAVAAGRPGERPVRIPARQSTLGKDQFASQAHVEDAKTDLDKANAAVMQAQANVELSTITLGYTEVAAPFDGIVTDHLVDVGALVGYSGPTKLASIVQMDPIHVYFTVSEQQVLQVKQGMRRPGPEGEGHPRRSGRDRAADRDGLSAQGDDRLHRPADRPPDRHPDRARSLRQQGHGAAARPVRPGPGAGRPPGCRAVCRRDRHRHQPARQLCPGAAARTMWSSSAGSRSGPPRPLRVVQDGIGPDDWVVIGGIQKAIPGNKVTPDKAAMAGQAAAGQAAAKP